MTKSPDLITSITRLALSGCSIQINPIPAMLGYLYVQIRIVPPPVENPGTPDEEWARWTSGQPTRLPLHAVFHTIYDRELIAAFLDTAVKLYTRHSRP